MPTVRRFGSTRYFFFSNEGSEPPHVHVEDGGALAKFWLEPVALAASSGFPSHRLKKIQIVVSAHRQAFLEAWREHFRTNP